MKKKNEIKRMIIKSFKNSRYQIILYMIANLAMTYLITVIPLIIQYFIDHILKQNSNKIWLEYFIKGEGSTFIISTCIALIIIQMIILTTNYIKQMMKNRIIQSFQYALKLNVFNFIQSLTYDSFYHNSLSDLVQKASGDVNRIVTFIDKQLTFFIDISLTIIFAIVQLSNLDIRLSVIMLVSSTMIIYLSYRYYQKVRPTLQKEILIQNELYSRLDNNFTNMKFIKVNNLEEKEEEKWKKAVDAYTKINEERIKISSHYNMLIENIVKLQAPFIFMLGGYLYYIQAITLGSIYVVLSYSNRITKAFTDVSEILNAFNEFMVSYKRLKQIMELTVEEEKISNRKIAHVDIIFKDACIWINGNCILRDLNIEIKEYERVIIMGATGSGKSILFKTLIGFYPYTGSITIGGYELRELNKKEIREVICLLLQDSYLFSKTIAENIKILNPYMPDQEMMHLAKFFELHQDINHLKDGYNSYVGRKGIALSKGQKQRLLLTRAFGKRKPVMILDDSFSAIDARNKRNIIQHVLDLKKDFTIILIGHDMQWVDKFDKIIYLHEGKAISGTHSQLLQNESYKKIYELNQNQLGEEYV